MTAQEIRLRRLAGQHLLCAADPQTVVRDLCGLQAQFLGHALHALALRSPQPDTAGMVKSWTVRGTMHLFSAGDLPLFLHEGRSHFLRLQDTLATDECVPAGRKEYFAQLVLEAVGRGVDDRQALKAVCQAAGMTPAEGDWLFDAWGGLIRALCEDGRLCHKVQQQKAYALCPPFVPMDRHSARLEMTRRYFAHFGPASPRDAAYFFGAAQADIKTCLAELPLKTTQYAGQTLYYDGETPPAAEMPAVVFLAGFDQLLLGYRKDESLFLPAEQLRAVFSLSGIVRPAVLVNGAVAGCWKLQNRKLSVTLFDGGASAAVARAAEQQWPDLRGIAFL